MSKHDINNLSNLEFSEFIDEVVNISYGIQDQKAFSEIIKLYEENDVRAKYAIALYIIDYDLYESVLDKKKIPPNGYKLMYELSKEGYIPAKAYLSRFDNDIFYSELKINRQNIFNIRMDMLNKSIEYFGGKKGFDSEADILDFDWRIIYLTRADLKIFGDTVDNQEKKLIDYKSESKFIDFKNIILDYENCFNFTKDNYCARRISEIYKIGIGNVDQDLKKSKEWSKKTN